MYKRRGCVYLSLYIYTYIICAAQPRSRGCARRACMHAYGLRIRFNMARISSTAIAVLSWSSIEGRRGEGH